jgi:hypothetical protein
VNPQRTHPLSAADLELVVDDEDMSDDRHERFRASVRGLRVGNVTSKFSERTLLVLGGILAPLGLVAVLIGWYGASRTPYLFEQVPYLISGGLLGLGLVFLGSFMYFAHWLTELVKEHRTQSAAILAALDRLHDDLASGSPSSRARSNGS